MAEDKKIIGNESIPLSLLSGVTGEKEIAPIPKFGKYAFNTPEEAVNFIYNSDRFLPFWNRQNVGLENIGIRGEINPTYAFEFTKPTPASHWAKLIEFDLEKNRNHPSRSPEMKAAIEKNIKGRQLGIRGEGRFYSTLSHPRTKKDLVRLYINPNAIAPHKQLDSNLPIRLIADENYHKYSLSGEKPFAGLIPEYPETMSVSDALREIRNKDLSRFYGTRLGAALSSNPEPEAFVPSGMARKARTVGYIQGSKKPITLYGAPKEGAVLNAMLKNIVPFASNAMSKAGPVLVPLQIGMQAYGATSDNMYDREYGMSDPLALRPVIDMAFAQDARQATGSFKNLVTDPEWQMRNPVSATYYNAMVGNFEPAKAFFGAYIPWFLK